MAQTAPSAKTVPYAFQKHGRSFVDENAIDTLGAAQQPNPFDLKTPE